MAPSISIREYICWDGQFAQEPTSTLVLTTDNNHFVDIRILKPVEADEPDLPNTGCPMSRLDWAFAGTSTSRPAPSLGGDVRHSVWEHWVDSRIPFGADPAVDEGDMYAQPDGERILERGKMVNPATGLLTKYEEMWRDVEAEMTGEDSTKFSVLITIDEPETKTRGMVVRVGQWCQGLVKIGDEITLERWEYVKMEGKSEECKCEPGKSEEVSGKEANSEGGKNEDGKIKKVDGDWTRCLRLGGLFLPCSITFKADELVPGSQVNHGECTWIVQEKYAWNN